MLVTNHPVYMLRGRDKFAFESDGTLSSRRPLGGRGSKRTSVGCPLWHLPAVNTWLVRGFLTFILIPFSLFHLDRILSCRVSRYPDGDLPTDASLRKSRSRWFFERGSTGSQNFQIYRPIYGAVLEQPSLPEEKFGPRDVASRFLFSILMPHACRCRCLLGSHRLKVRIVVRLDFASKISLLPHTTFFFLCSRALRHSARRARGIMEKLDSKLVGKRSKEI